MYTVSDASALQHEGLRSQCPYSAQQMGSQPTKTLQSMHYYLMLLVSRSATKLC